MRVLVLIGALFPAISWAQPAEDAGGAGDAATQAGMTLLQYGAIGAMLLLSVIGLIILARYIASLYDRILAEKDKQTQDALRALEAQSESTKNLEATAATMKEVTHHMKAMAEKFLDARERELEGRR